MVQTNLDNKRRSKHVSILYDGVVMKYNDDDKKQHLQNEYPNKRIVYKLNNSIQKASEYRMQPMTLFN